MARVSLNRRVQFRRFAGVDDGFQFVRTWSDLGSLIWAGRQDLTAVEKVAGGWIEASVVTQVFVRSSPFARGITVKDRLICDGLDFDIQGIRAQGQRGLLIMTAVARVGDEDHHENNGLQGA